MKTEKEIRRALETLRQTSANNTTDRNNRKKIIAALEWVLGGSLPLLDEFSKGPQ